MTAGEAQHLNLPNIQNLSEAEVRPPTSNYRFFFFAKIAFQLSL
jgi:hypothetical protein